MVEDQPFPEAVQLAMRAMSGRKHKADEDDSEEEEEEQEEEEKPKPKVKKQQVWSSAYPPVFLIDNSHRLVLVAPSARQLSSQQLVPSLKLL